MQQIWFTSVGAWAVLKAHRQISKKTVFQKVLFM